MVTTPAGINPFTGDPNWQRLATYLVGAASTGIGLNEYGNLINLSTASGATVAGIAPVKVVNNTVSLDYLAPLITSAGSLGLAYASPLYVNNGTLSILIPAATASALKVSGGSLWLATAAPLGQLGTTAGTLTLNIGNGLTTSTLTGALMANVDGTTIDFDGTGKLSVLLDLNGPLTVVDGLNLSLGDYLEAQGSTGSKVLEVVNADSGEGNLGTVTSGSPGFSSVTSAKYRWARIGNIVHLWVKIIGTNVGSRAVSYVYFTLPADVPTPALWGTQNNSEYQVFGTGAIGTDGLCTGANDSGFVGIYLDSGGNWKLEIDSVLGNVVATYAWAHVSYLAD